MLCDRYFKDTERTNTEEPLSRTVNPCNFIFGGLIFA